MPKYIHAPAFAFLSVLVLASFAVHAAEGSGGHASLVMSPAPACGHPPWPAEALRRGDSGTVQLRFLIGEDGKVAESLVAKSSGSALLDETARKWVARCTFKPAVANGFPVASWAPVQYVWTLSGRQTDEGIEKAKGLRSRALNGDVDAVYALYQMFKTGDGVKADDATAEKLLRVAAARGHAAAAFDLAQRLNWGKPATRNADEAQVWYDKAAELGNASAQYHVGREYLRGTGRRKADPAKAVALLRKAAEQDNRAAQLDLARMYATGNGVPQDPAEAAAWYRKAAQGDSPDAHFALGSVLANGTGVDKDAGEAVTWLTRAAQLRHPGAEMRLATLYLNGDGVARNPAEAIKLLRRAVQGGHVPAMATLGEMLVRGTEMPADPAEGWAWLRKAAERGSAPARKSLESMPVEYASAHKQ